MKITVDSNLHKCFHEVGHIEVAHLYGAVVTGAALDAHGNGVTSIKHKEDLSTKRPVACGGYAVERILYESERLVDVQGMPLSLEAFESQAMNNARRDKFPFYLTQPADSSGVFPNTPFQPGPGNTWPLESNTPFITYTMQNIVPKLRPRLFVIEALAHELCRYGPLTQSEIEAIWADMS